MSKKKWQIENLDDKLPYYKAANFVIKNRLNQVQTDIKEYFTRESVEALHRIRISLRRLRYSMELFISCYDRKKFMILYDIVTDLQDLSGKVRDFDVMTENMDILLKKEKVRISKNVFRKVDDIRSEFHIKLKLDLMEFIHSKGVKSFEELLK
jgi:CHAD domain-containing protein